MIPDTYVLQRQFRVGADKQRAWDLYMGQKVLCQATAIVPDTASVITAPITPRVRYQVYNGYQTYKQATNHQNLNLWIPLLLWFNTDPHLAFPSVSVRYRQRFITFQLTADSNSNIYRVIVNHQAGSEITALVLLILKYLRLIFTLTIFSHFLKYMIFSLIV